MYYAWQQRFRFGMRYRDINVEFAQLALRFYVRSQSCCESSWKARFFQVFALPT